jgi:hypothetical protein
MRASCGSRGAGAVACRDHDQGETTPMACTFLTFRRGCAAAIAIAGLLVGGCAMSPRAVPYDTVRVVDKAVLPQGTFVLVHRIYIENWHVQVYMPWYDTREQALDALRTEAAARGADAVTNVSCIPVAEWTRVPKVFCHGDAVKLTPEGARRVEQALAS